MAKMVKTAKMDLRVTEVWKSVQFFEHFFVRVSFARSLIYGGKKRFSLASNQCAWAHEKWVNCVHMLCTKLVQFTTSFSWNIPRQNNQLYPRYSRICHSCCFCDRWTGWKRITWSSWFRVSLQRNNCIWFRFFFFIVKKTCSHNLSCTTLW